MNLFNSLRTGLSGLISSQTALRTTGHNISNANTPGYSRQRAIVENRTPVDMERYQLGLGSEVTSIERLVDQTLETRIRESNASLENLAEQRSALSRVEQIFGPLSEHDLGNQISKFFDSLEDLANSPSDMSVRSQVVSNAQQMTDQFQSISNNLLDARVNLDEQVQQVTNDINRQLQEIAELNETIVQRENGGIDKGAANDLRDRRGLLLRKLAKNIDIDTRETSSGAVNVRAGTRTLVFGERAEEIDTRKEISGGIEIHIPQIASTGSALPDEGGALAGLMKARDEDLGGIQTDLNRLAKSIQFEVNKLHSEGVGLNRLTEVTSSDSILQPAVDNSTSGSDPSASPDGPPLATNGTVDSATTKTSIVDSSLAGLPDNHFNGMRLLIKEGPNQGIIRRVEDFEGSSGTLRFDSPLPERLSPGTEFQITSLNQEIQNGSFDIVVTNESTGASESFNIEVDLDKIGSDSDLQDIVDEINSEVGGSFSSITASVTSENRLSMESSSDNIRFRFEDDSSNFLGAIGINTFFSGSNASDFSVREVISERPDRITAALSGPQGDNNNAIRLLELRNEEIMSEGTETFEENYESLVGQIGTDLENLKNRTENQRSLNEQLLNQRERVSGVNLDEEAVNMIEFQKQFQASARFISTVNQMLNSLLQAT